MKKELKLMILKKNNIQVLYKIEKQTHFGTEFGIENSNSFVSDNDIVIMSSSHADHENKCLQVAHDEFSLDKVYTATINTYNRYLKAVKSYNNYFKEKVTKIKPCPFCGGGAIIFQEETDMYNVITCEDCQFPRFRGPKDTIIQKWNTRSKVN